MAITLEPAAPLDGEVLLSLADAKLYLRVEDDDEDDLIGALRNAAIDWVERYTARALIRRSFVWTASRFAMPLQLTVEPVSAITGVSYFERSQGQPVVLTRADWRLSGRELTPAAGATWPSDAVAGVEVTLEAGYAAGAAPPSLVSAVRLMLAHLYRNRDAVMPGGLGEAPLGVTALCAMYRTPVIG